MCCISKEKKTKTAETDIRVIKVIQKKANGYRTPYRHCYLKKDIIDGERPLIAYCNKWVKLKKALFRHFFGKRMVITPIFGRIIADDMGTDKLYVYEENLIHSFPSEMNINFTDNNKGFEVFDCIIPKGSEYIEGETYSFHSNLHVSKTKTYASSQIIFVGKHEN